MVSSGAPVSRSGFGDLRFRGRYSLPRGADSDMFPIGARVETISGPGSHPEMRLMSDMATMRRHILGYAGSINRTRESIAIKN